MKEIVCPECGKVLEAGVATCPNCGCPIAAECPTVPCHYCGNMIADNATVCPKCGGNVESSPKCGVLRIVRAGQKFVGSDSAPLYVNGQLIETIPLSRGCNRAIPLAHPNITITYKDRIATLEHTYTLDTQQDYYLEIDTGFNIGFVLRDKAYNIISTDKMNAGWFILCALFSPIGLWFSYYTNNTRPARAQYMRRLSLNTMLYLALGWSIAILVLLTD